MSELFDAQGRRLYLTRDERDAVLAAAERAERRTRTLCLTLAHTGCRISEALELTAGRVDLDGRALVFETLKKRRRGVYRAVPVPPRVLDALDLVHGVREAQKRRNGGHGVRLWPWARSTAWLRLQRVMHAAGIKPGPHATPKGFRHGFGVAAVQVGIPLNLVQRWLGHAQLSTTAIYADALGAEERSIAERMWS
jgi:integrase/recombinase XerD